MYFIILMNSLYLAELTNMNISRPIQTTLKRFGPKTLKVQRIENATMRAQLKFLNSQITIPKRPMNSFGIFAVDKYKTKYPNQKMVDRFKSVGMEWRNLSHVEKQVLNFSY